MAPWGTRDLITPPLHVKRWKQSSEQSRNSFQWHDKLPSKKKWGFAYDNIFGILLPYLFRLYDAQLLKVHFTSHFRWAFQHKQQCLTK